MHIKGNWFIKINDLIKNQNYIKPVIVGHSSDDSKDIIDAFLSAGADFFEKKPSSL